MALLSERQRTVLTMLKVNGSEQVEGVTHCVRLLGWSAPE